MAEKAVFRGSEGSLVENYEEQLLGKRTESGEQRTVRKKRAISVLVAESLNKGVK
jgi:hypothetical protein